MNTDYDIVIIGGGILGCFTARNLARYNWNIAVFEKNCDVCTEVSKANTAIIYSGYDPKPGSLKARMSIQAIQNFERLCESLSVRHSKLGSLMVSFGDRGDSALIEKYNQGKLNGVADLRIISAAETIALEPGINNSVTGALYAPDAATLNPWELGIAGAVNAANNSVSFNFNAEITGIEKKDDVYILFIGDRAVTAKAVVNCAGLFGDEVSEMINYPRFKIETSVADYLLLDEKARSFVNHIVMYEPEEKRKRISIVPTVDGNILLGPSRIKTDSKESFDTTRVGCEQISNAAEYVFPNLPLNTVIRTFASIRPSISLLNLDEEGNYYPTSERVHDLLIYETENPGFINLAGIKTPGLTCCDEIGKHVTDMLLDILGNPGENTEFSEKVEKPKRFREMTYKEQDELIKKDHCNGKIVCRCRHITEAEIRRSIRETLGAKTLDGVKRRMGAQMGRCQGGFCTQKIIEILAEELGVGIEAVRKDNKGSELI